VTSEFSKKYFKNDVNLLNFIIESTSTKKKYGNTKKEGHKSY
jgi:hypothetical protein